jgi:hypothetical protein
VQQRQKSDGDIQFFGLYEGRVRAKAWIVGNRQILYPKAWWKDLQMQIAKIHRAPNVFLKFGLNCAAVLIYIECCGKNQSTDYYNEHDNP